MTEQQGKHADTTIEWEAGHAETATMVRHRLPVTTITLTADLDLDVSLTPVSGDMLAVIRAQGIAGVLRRRTTWTREAQTQ